MACFALINYITYDLLRDKIEIYQEFSSVVVTYFLTELLLSKLDYLFLFIYLPCI
jgi:hypothetical protein